MTVAYQYSRFASTSTMSSPGIVRHVRLTIYLVMLVFMATDARVVDYNFNQGCLASFYLQKPPVHRTLRDTQSICQMTQTDHFATRYNKNSRIPLYSAYQLHAMTCNGSVPSRTDKWYVEPQLLNPGDNPSMTRVTSRPLVPYRTVQATEKDYEKTGYDKGHLNPNGHHCTEAERNATFALTNVVPQDPCFNRVDWGELEKHTYNALKSACTFEGARRYIVTGAVPSDRAIPLDVDRPDAPTTDLHRVTIPSHMWSAVCCDSSAATNVGDKHKGWSYGYIGTNKALSSITVMSVDELNRKLEELQFGTSTALQIFSQHKETDGSSVRVYKDCVFDETNSKDQFRRAKSVALRQSLRNIPEFQSVDAPTRTLAQTVEMLGSSDSRPSKIRKINAGVTAVVDYKISETTVEILAKNIGSVQTSLRAWDLTAIACVIKISVLSSPRSIRDEYILKKRSVSLDSDMIAECPLTTLEQASNLTLQGHSCRADHQCQRRGSAYSWCYIDDSDNYGKCCEKPCTQDPSSNEFTCDVGSSKMEPCSPSWALDRTYNGKLCKSDHHCGKHGVYRKHWCYTVDGSWDQCCATWHSCGRHGEDYDWCYTYYSVIDREDKNWRRCVPSL